MTLTRIEANASDHVGVVSPTNGSPTIAARARSWLSARLFGRAIQRSSRHRLVLICAVVFLMGLGVRLLYWEDSAVDMSINDTLTQNMARQYRREAQRILADGTLLYPRSQVDPGDARLIVHPPGYSIIMSASFKLFGETETPLRLLQVICDAAGAVVVFFICLELFPLAVAIISALFMALSPHAAYYSLRLSPDSLAVLPILVAVYLIIKTDRRRLPAIAIAGALIGVSCWLRANALLLAPVLAVLMVMLSVRGKRLWYSMALVSATVIVISPISIRNWVIYHRFVPLALPAGVNLVQGVAELDKERRFGMPLFDPDVLKADAEWNNRPEYASHMWTPDGIERDHTRFARGLAVIRSHPLWYAGGMLRRAAFMISYNESRARDWPFKTATVPLLSIRPPFGHSIMIPTDKPPFWTEASASLFSSGRLISPDAEISAANNGAIVQLAGGGAPFENQWVSAPISVSKNTDYLFELQIELKQGKAAVKVYGATDKVVLSSSVIHPHDDQVDGKRKGENEIGPAEKVPMAVAFASDDAAEVRLALSNDSPSTDRTIVEVGEPKLFELGKTPAVWTHYPRVMIRGVEKEIFRTQFMLPLLLSGAGLLVFAGRGRTLLTLLAVPAYYVATHAPFSTEYRYILAIHCFLFILAAVTVYSGAMFAGQLLRWSRKRLFNTDAQNLLPGTGSARRGDSI